MATIFSRKGRAKLAEKRAGVIAALIYDIEPIERPFFGLQPKPLPANVVWSDYSARRDRY